MIELGINQGNPVLSQFSKRPLVYLDHWAVRKISSEEELARRFAELLEQKSATFVLSLVSFMEFSIVDDISDRQAFENFIEQCFPNIFFMEFEPFTVIAGENINPQYSSAVSDRELLKLIQDRFSLFSGSIDVRGIVEDYYHLDVRNALDEIKIAFVKSIDKFKLEAEQNDKRKKDILRPISNRQSVLRTHIVLRELLRPFYADGRRNVDPNDAIDFYHATVPASYCDIIALDKKWCNAVESAQKRIRNANLSIKLATTCSEVNSVMSFLENC